MTDSRALFCKRRRMPTSVRSRSGILAISHNPFVRSMSIPMIISGKSRIRQIDYGRSPPITPCLRANRAGQLDSDRQGRREPNSARSIASWQPWAAQPVKMHIARPSAERIVMSLRNDRQGFATRSIHLGYDPLDYHGALNPPVFLTSTYAFDTTRSEERRVGKEC